LLKKTNEIRNSSGEGWCGGDREVGRGGVVVIEKRGGVVWW